METELMILKFLRENDMHAYQIIKRLQNNGARKFIDFTQDNVYKKIVVLEKKKYIIGYILARDKQKDIKIFHITDLGKEYFEECIKLECSKPLKLFSNVNIILMNFDYLSGYQRIKYLNKLRKEINEEKMELDNINKKQEFVTYIDYILYTKRKKELNALDEWAIETIKGMTNNINK